MQSEIERNIEQLNILLENLLEKTNKTCPVLNRAMQESLTTSSQQLKSFASNAEIPVYEILSESKENIINNSALFIRMQEGVGLLLLSLEEGIGTLSNLENDIARIKDDSMEIELISLNAMTVALKSGEAGRAFSVITDELKRLSSRTIALTEELSELGFSALKDFEAFRHELFSLKKEEKEILKEIKEQTLPSFSSLKTILTSVATAYSELIDWSRELLAPLSALEQSKNTWTDLISLTGHLKGALIELKKEEKNTSEEVLLFEKNLIELAFSIAENAVNLLEEADRNIKTSMDSIKDYMERGQERSSALFKQYCEKNNTESLQFQFKGLDGQLQSIATKTSFYKNKTKPLIRSGERLSLMVETLERRFKAFSKIISRFKTITIASRIEVAKQKSLIGMDDTVKEMAIFTERIAKDVQKALSDTQAFMENSKTAILLYNHLIEEEFINIERAEAKLFEIKENLLHIASLILNKMERFTLFNKSFVEKFAKTDQVFKESKAVNDLAKEIKEIFANILKEKIKDIEKTGIQDSNINIEDERLRTLIQKYTAYAHRRSQERSDKPLLDGFVELNAEDFF